MKSDRIVRWILPAILVVLSPTAAMADGPSAAEILPGSTLVYAEIQDVPEIVDGLISHPLREKIEAIPGIQGLYETPQYRQAQTVRQVFEQQAGSDWMSLLRGTAGGGIAVGVDSETNGIALLIRAGDESTQQKTLDTIIELARRHASDQGNPDPITTGEYRGIEAYKAHDSVAAIFNGWLMITNKSQLAQRIADNVLDGANHTLANDARFQEASKHRDADANAWGYVSLGALRDAGVASELFRGTADNPVAEILLGGILSNLQQTPFVTATLHLTQQSAQIEVATPHDMAWVSEPREYYFGPDGSGTAPSRLEVDDCLATLGTYRDLAAMWMQAGDLLDERAADGIAKADSTLSTLFSGKDFGEDILGAIYPEIQFVVARQAFGQGESQPAIKFPAFAIVVRLREPDTMQAELRRTFQSLVGFLNVTNAQKGQPQLDLGFERLTDGEIVSATFVPPRDAEDPSRLPVQFNFSPSIAFVGERAVVASSMSLARELATASADSASDAACNTEATMAIPVLREVLQDNWEQLVAKNMLEKGHDKAEAEAEIGALMTVIGFFDDVALRLTLQEDSLKLQGEVNLK